MLKVIIKTWPKSTRTWSKAQIQRIAHASCHHPNPSQILTLVEFRVILSQKGDREVKIRINGVGMGDNREQREVLWFLDGFQWVYVSLQGTQRLLSSPWRLSRVSSPLQRGTIQSKPHPLSMFIFWNWIEWYWDRYIIDANAGVMFRYPNPKP